MSYLLDTHTWIWLNTHPQKLSTKVKKILLHPKTSHELLLSAISIWEFCKLVEKQRYRISINPEAWIEEALDFPNLRLLPLTPQITYQSTCLPPPFHSDPTDQIIVASARAENATLLTCDEKMLSYPNVKSLW